MKGVWTLKNFFSLDTNLVFINFFLYYQNSITSKYKRKIKKKNSAFVLSTYSKNFSTIFRKYIDKLGYNLYMLRVVNLNALVDKQKMPFLFDCLKSFSSSIFARRYNLFLDFIKMTILFFDNYIDLSGYIKVWVRIFKYLSKRLHGKFFFFVKKTIESLILLNKKKFRKQKIFKNKIQFCLHGIKFLLTGRIRGKFRASSTLIQIGSVPTQTLNKNIDFASSHVNTLYGVFGLKIWSYIEKI